MKTFAPFCIILALAMPLYLKGADGSISDDKAHDIALQIATADYARISSYSTDRKAIAVKDRSWIRRAAKVLYGASYQRLNHVLDITTMVTFYDASGKMLHDLMVFSGRVKLDGVDYKVDDASSTTLGNMIKEKVANQLPDPTSPSVTPPAGAGVAPSVTAVH